MREIKFRAWTRGKMWDVFAIDWGNNGEIISCHLIRLEQTIKIYPNEKVGDKVDLMQYTDLKDKNGKEIYEGDIVRWFHDCEDGLCMFDPLSKKCPEYEQTVIMWCEDAAAFSIPIATIVEVIGNIYENPELLVPPPHA